MNHEAPLVESMELAFVAYAVDPETGYSIPTEVPGLDLVHEGDFYQIVKVADVYAREFRGAQIDLVVIEPQTTNFVFTVAFGEGVGVTSPGGGARRAGRTTHTPDPSRGVLEVWAWVNRGAARYELGDHAGVIEDCSTAIGIDPELAVAYMFRGLAREARDPQAALPDFSTVIRLEPQDAIAHYNRGNVRRRLRDFAGAIEDYGIALRLDPRKSKAHTNRGNARYDAGDLSGAIADYGAAIALDPADALAYQGRGTARAAGGDLDGAREDYSAAIRIDPGLAEAYSGRGFVRHHRGDLAGAIEDYDAAIRLDPGCVVALRNRGRARHARHDLAGAVEDYGAAVALDPACWDVRISLGFALAHLGRRAEARASFDEAVRMCPPGERAAVRERRRRALGE